MKARSARARRKLRYSHIADELEAARVHLGAAVKALREPEPDYEFARREVACVIAVMPFLCRVICRDR